VKNTTKLIPILVSSLILSLLFLISPTASAQSKCKDLVAMYRVTFRVNLFYEDSTNFGWTIDSNGITATLDGEVLRPTVEFDPEHKGVSFFRGRPDYMAGVGHDEGQVNVWHFNEGEFTVGDWHAVYPNQPANIWGDLINPPSSALFVYDGTGKIIGGGGAFAGASGSFTETGPFLQWLEWGQEANNEDPGALYLHGLYFAQISAKVCSR
jgi:hypothetical protein